MTVHNPDLDRAIRNLMKEHHIVGLSACRVQDGEIVWANGYGWADIASRRPMTPDVIQNIGSISKTFTCTALMQLWEQGLFQLDDSVNDYLPFKVHHPRHATPITFRHLLTHTGAIADGPAYPASYACGDPQISLSEWVRAYLLPGGKFYDPEKNFHPWQPGAGWSYTNVGYGLLGYLVEHLSGEPFNRYCRGHIFVPLGMKSTGWLLSEVDINNHATPYATSGSPVEFKRLYAAGDEVENGSEPIPLCLYSFPNFSDGLVRTSARELALYGAAFSKANKNGIPLKSESMQRCFTPEVPAQEVGGMMKGLGLTWFNVASFQTPGDIQFWGHDGGDPGINTRLQLSLASHGAIVILANTNHTQECMDALTDLVWQAA